MYNGMTYQDAVAMFDGGEVLNLFSLHDDPIVVELKNEVERELLYACYEQEAYEGSAFVLYRENGVLYEVNGSHCSCYGLEGQWSPEAVTVEELQHRLDKGWLGNWQGFSEVFERLKHERS